MIEITSVRVETAEREGDVLGYASIVLARVLVVRGIRIVRAGERRIVAMPSRMATDGVWRDHVYALTPGLRDTIQAKVLQAFDKQSGYNAPLPPTR